MQVARHGETSTGGVEEPERRSRLCVFLSAAALASAHPPCVLLANSAPNSDRVRSRARRAAGSTDERHHHDRTSSDDPHDPHREPRLPGTSFLDDTHRRSRRHRDDDAADDIAEPARRTSVDDTLTALPPMTSRPADPPVRRRGLARVLLPRSSRAQPERAEQVRDEKHGRDVVHHAPHELLPEPHLPRASFVSLREAYDLPHSSSSHDYEPQHGRATAHDEHPAQESLAKRHASRGRRATRSHLRLADVDEDEGRRLREELDEREW